MGGSTDIEIGEEMDRYDDAFCATKAAMRSGILPGGGVALLRASESLDSNLIGHSIVKRATIRPFQKIVENAGFDGHVMKERVLE